MISIYHDSPLGGHSGINNTCQKLKKHFYWPGMQSDILQWVRQCDQCARCKTETCSMPWLLQPLPLPSQAWQHLSMDFIEQLPKSNGKDTILVVVCRFTKYGHFLPLAHPFSASSIAKLFLDNIYKLHGAPISIVSDRDKLFTSLF